jgi:hypothetical protein
VIGSLAILPAKQRTHISPFDYIDNYPSQSMLLRMDDICMVAVLNDAQASLQGFPEIRRITGPLSPPQMREILAHLSHMNLNLIERPRFSSHIDPDGAYLLGVELPESWRIGTDHLEVFGDLMLRWCHEFLVGDPQEEEKLRWMKQRRLSFLWDDRGRFDAESFDLKDVVE